MLGKFVILGLVLLLALPGCGVAKLASLGKAARTASAATRATKAASAATRVSQTTKATSMLRSGARDGRATDDELLQLLRNGRHDEFVSQFRHRMHVDARQADEAAKVSSRLSEDAPDLFHLLDNAHRAGDLANKLVDQTHERRDAKETGHPLKRP